MSETKNLEEKLKTLFAKQHSVDDSVFDAIVSNPPYQRETGNGAVAVYHHIMNMAKELGNHISMIYPARWIIGGRGEGIEDFRHTELTSHNYRSFIIDSRENGIFEDNSIKGGINYFHWVKTWHEKTFYEYNGLLDVRETLLNGQHIMILDPRFSRIVEKVKPENYIQVMPRNYYGIHLETDYSIEKLALKVPIKQREAIIGEEDLNNFTRIYYSSSKGGVHTTVIPKNAGKYSDEGYKLMVSRTADPDKKKNTLRRQNRMFILKPGEISGGSFLQAGLYETEIEAMNALKYMKTTFAMFMFGIITPVPSTVRNNYRLVPDIDFKTGIVKDFIEQSDVNTDMNKMSKFQLDFNEVEDSLDEQLFTMYSISEDEQKLMNHSVRHWNIEIPIFAAQIAK